MILYLWWGRNPDWWEIALNNQLECVREIFKRVWTKEVLHLPFARTGIMKKNRDAFWSVAFQNFVESLWIVYKNAAYIEDIEEFSGDTIYMNGWNDCLFLLEMCLNPLLYSTLLRTKNIIGESCWAVVLAKHFSSSKMDSRVDWLNLAKDSIIVPHYTERNRENKLLEGKEKYQTKYTIGIDETTFVKFENWRYWDVIWLWNIHYL